MLPVDVQETGLELLLPLMLCCMLPMMFRNPQSAPQRSSGSDSWFVTYGIQEAYDTIVEETDEWRSEAEKSRKKSRFAFLTRREPAVFDVDEAVEPRLYKLRDDKRGVISFELTKVADGGTSIKASYDPRAESLIQKFKTKLPVQIPTSNPNTCPSCGKEMMPDFKTCPYCGAELE